jgi:murein L,D-transpeptidase YafK
MLRPKRAALVAIRGIVTAIFVLILGGSVSFANSRVDRAQARVAKSLAPQLKQVDAKLGNAVFLRIFKQPAQLELWIAANDASKPFQLLKSYPICAFSGALGPKQREGDLQAPEGIYFVGKSQLNPASRFHLSFNLGYPNAYEQNKGYTGSALMVHGNCVSIGCYAMTDPMIEEIYWALHAYFLKLPAAKVQVQAFPFALTPENLAANAKHPAHAFWSELQPIYQAFSDAQRPPKVQVGARYRLIAP